MAQKDDDMGGLTFIRGLFRDVATPIAVMIFCAAVYTGYVRSPITEIQGKVLDLGRDVTIENGDISKLQAEDTFIEGQHSTMLENESKLARDCKDCSANIGMLRRICRNTAKNESERDLCNVPPGIDPEAAATK